MMLPLLAKWQVVIIVAKFWMQRGTAWQGPKRFRWTSMPHNDGGCTCAGRFGGHLHDFLEQWCVDWATHRNFAKLCFPHTFPPRSELRSETSLIEVMVSETFFKCSDRTLDYLDYRLIGHSLRSHEVWINGVSLYHNQKHFSAWVAQCIS